MFISWLIQKLRHETRIYDIDASRKFGASVSRFDITVIGPLFHKLQYLFLLDSSLRWDFLKAHQHNLTAFAYLRKHGVSIPSVTPVFPTEDYPVWTSLATGRELNMILKNPAYYINSTSQLFTTWFLRKYEVFVWKISQKEFRVACL